MSKVVEYVGFFHALKDRVKEGWTQFWLSESSDSVGVGDGVGSNGFVDDRETNFRVKVKEKLERLKHQTIRRIDRSSSVDEDFSHLTRHKSRRELLQVSAAVMGIEFSYAAETAFVSPLLLKIGLRHRHMTLMWCLSPLVGFFVTPLLGSLSDGCRSELGRRRPFIILLSIGIVLGLILVPNGKTLGRLLGDTYKDDPLNLKILKTLPDVPLILPRIFSSPKPILIFQENPKNQGKSTPGLQYGTITSTKRLATSTNLTVGFGASLNSDEIRISHINRTTEATEPVSLFKKVYNSKYTPTIEDHGFRARNNLDGQDTELEEKEFLQSLGKRERKLKLDEDNLDQIVSSAFANTGDEDHDGGNTRKNFNIANEEFNKETHLQTGGLSLGEELRTNINENNVTSQYASQKVGVEQAEVVDEDDKSLSEDEESIKNHPWGLVFTVLGTVLLDFNADACQSPSRAYMLDVTVPEDHARGLSTFTVMAGLGGCLGYLLGALNWENTFIGHFFGGQVRAVFTLVLFIFIACVITTIRSFREIPIDRLWAGKPGYSACDPNRATAVSSYSKFEEDPEQCTDYPSENTKPGKTYGSTAGVSETSFNGIATSNIPKPLALVIPVAVEEPMPTFKEYLKTIVILPKSLQWLCVTNFFCWMSLVCYSLYFTDFVGEAVFHGDPTAPLGSIKRTNYDDGVRWGCFGMSLYSLSCSLYSLGIESLVSRFGAKRVYITGQLVYSVGMVMMAITRHPLGVIVFSWTAGIMYATLFTMPYLLVARYHAAETFDIDVDDLVSKPNQMRGLGTDVAIVSSMVFLAQMTQALTLGSVVAAAGSTTAIVCAAALFASCGALAATKVLYLDL